MHGTVIQHENPFRKELAQIESIIKALPKTAEQRVLNILRYAINDLLSLEKNIDLTKEESIEKIKNLFAKNPDKKIVIIGRNKIPEKGLLKLLNEFGIPKDSCEFVCEYFENNKKGESLQNFFNESKYVAVLLGPIAHSVKGKSGTGVQYQSSIPVIKVKVGDKKPKVTIRSVELALLNFAKTI